MELMDSQLYRRVIILTISSGDLFLIIANHIIFAFLSPPTRCNPCSDWSLNDLICPFIFREGAGFVFDACNCHHPGYKY